MSKCISTKELIEGRYRSNGKLLLSGEYVVLDGALALAVPTKFGQDMLVSKGTNQHLVWRSLDWKNRPWFEGTFEVPTGKYINGDDEGVGKTLEQMFAYISSVRPDFLADKNGTNVSTRLDFDRTWGLGSSSTMIRNLADWADVDPFDLLANTMGGSGYDIACAGVDYPIIYQVQEDSRAVLESHFNPSYKADLYFVHLGKKQNSRDSIKYYRQNVANNPMMINNISIITKRMISATTANEFGSLCSHHESMMSSLLKLPTVKSERFPDFWGEVKSLGGWGGDFAMVVSTHGYKDTKAYFDKKGYPTLVSYHEMVL